MELRQYTVVRGFRDRYAERFDRLLVDPQESVGMRVFAQFRDLDDPDRFVWLRGFEDMDDRLRALTEFYDESEAWQENSRWATDLVTDWNALLLRPVREFPAVAVRPPTVDAGANPASCFLATICRLDGPVDDEFVAFFTENVVPLLAGTGADLLGCFRTEYAEDFFVQMPVLAPAHVFAWFSSFSDQDRRREHERRLAWSADWNDVVFPELSQRLSAPPQRLLLSPTSRSLLR